MRYAQSNYIGPAPQYSRPNASAFVVVVVHPRRNLLCPFHFALVCFVEIRLLCKLNNDLLFKSDAQAPPVKRLKLS